MERCAALFAKTYATHATELAPAGLLKGWTTGSAIAAAGGRWPAFLKTLARDVQAHGADLTAAAKDYAATDAEAARSLTRAGG